MARRDPLVARRNARGWSQADVVAELSTRFSITITTSYYGMIEQGVRTPKLPLAFAIAKLFECAPEELFFEPKSNEMLGMNRAEHTA